MKTRRIAGLGGLMVAGAIGAAAVLAASPARADDNGFLLELQEFGFTIYSPTMVLANGHGICDALENHSPAEVVQDFFNQAPRAELPDIGGAQIWVSVAVDQLCPGAGDTPTQAPAQPPASIKEPMGGQGFLA
jgi:hypothetical protein